MNACSNAADFYDFDVTVNSGRVFMFRALSDKDKKFWFKFFRRYDKRQSTRVIEESGNRV
jgi:hypothetical protein